ncbi:protein prenylyltransferase [Pluteus cervinus]|uniref:Protein prenylyltransferase n=1 Tax=Pluteus cervinus TaxID=181527 RepID=A0ACD3B767_9AGAR|nr:protein prenylyltransferase [Pluteus cervinus]
MTSPADVLYADNPAWADVTPLPQYEGVNPLAPILYTEEYKDATDYFRGIVKTGEKSPRVLELTEKIIRLNPAHYSAWQYRFETLKAVKVPLEDELKLMDELAVKYLKTYQVWHHRRLLLTESYNLEPKRELEFIAKSLKADTKNYHTWSYRQWLLAFVNDGELWVGELDFVEEMLNEDLRNNSAWHHRFFVVWLGGGGGGMGVGGTREEKERVLRRELTFTKQLISLAPNNPSAWNYLRGVLDRTETPYGLILPFVRLYIVNLSDRAGSTDIVDVENPPPSEGAQLPCTAALEFTADAYERQGDDEGRKKAVELWKVLANEQDTIRKRYWEFRIRGVEKKVGA